MSKFAPTVQQTLLVHTCILFLSFYVSRPTIDIKIENRCGCWLIILLALQIFMTSSLTFLEKQNTMINF